MQDRVRLADTVFVTSSAASNNLHFYATTTPHIQPKSSKRSNNCALLNTGVELENLNVFISKLRHHKQAFRQAQEVLQS